MESKQVNTEQMILSAAEKLFVAKGYAGTRTTEIAESAGVNHAMLHYYFRTKENLFGRIFQEKADQMLDFFVQAFNSDLPFFEKLTEGIEKHFDFIAQNPALPFFVLRELILNDERKNFVREKMAPVAFAIMKQISTSVQHEIEKGTIRPILAQDLLLNVVSLNVFSFIALQILFDVNDDYRSPVFRQFLE
ncbi:MAG: TetR/AcrR family transcriptional regulator, partial [Dysgonamonadaceae bacterium]|nr:TetR/AcrR family transcriptional regulator [Dysgonamonadaceae bacterium]